MRKSDDVQFLYTRPMRMHRRSPLLMGSLFVVLLFGGYVVLQAGDVLFGPTLSLATPLNGETVVGRVFVSGKTEPNTRLTINGYETFSDDNGYFSENLPLSDGYHDVIVKVKNRFDKEQFIKRAIIVQCGKQC